jgi:hypothetical protein
VANSLLAKDGISLMRAMRLEVLERAHSQVGALLLDDLCEECIESAGIRRRTVGPEQLDELLTRRCSGRTRGVPAP